MIIRHIEAWERKHRLSEPYTIAYETVSEFSSIFLRIETNTGLMGYGCTAPDFMVTGETPRETLALLENEVFPFLIGQNPFRMTFLLEHIKAQYPERPALRNGVDMALFDLLARKADLPLYQLLGAYRTSIATSYTIGILDVEETLERAKDAVEKGFFILKIKGGRNVEEDIERMQKCWETFGKDIRLRFDANQGYSIEQTYQFVEGTKDCHIEMLEQPTDRYALQSLGTLSKNVALPIMADESLMGLNDVFRLAKNDWADMINIKLLKVGGIYEAQHVNSVAKAAGYEVMVGCMDECALGIAAGLHLALSRPNIEFADLDGHFDLVDDPTKAALIFDKGMLHPSDKPGLGIEFEL